MKARATFYVDTKKKTSKQLVSFIASNIDTLMNMLDINIVKISSKNIKVVKNSGITHTPTLVLNNRHIPQLSNILPVLNNMIDKKPSTSKFVSGEGNIVDQYQHSIMHESDSEDSDSFDRSNIQRKMADIQSRRPEMLEVDDGNKIMGGRKMRKTKKTDKTYDSDTAFLKASKQADDDYGMGNDDENFLEQYKLDWARGFDGKHMDHKKKIKGRR